MPDEDGNNIKSINTLRKWVGVSCKSLKTLKVGKLAVIITQTKIV